MTVNYVSIAWVAMLYLSFYMLLHGFHIKIQKFIVMVYGLVLLIYI